MLQLALRRKRRKLACISVVYVAAMNECIFVYAFAGDSFFVIFVFVTCCLCLVFALVCCLRRRSSFSSSSAHVLSRYEVVSYAYLMFFKDDCFRGAGQRLVFPTRLQSFIVVRWLLSGQVFQDASEPLKAS